MVQCGHHLLGSEPNKLQVNDEDITSCRCGGRCISAEYTDAVGELAKSYGLQLHIDGARIFNASTVRLQVVCFFIYFCLLILVGRLKDLYNKFRT